MSRIYYTTESYIQKAKLKHNNKYTYEKFIYINAHEKAIVTCPIHGDFRQKPGAHLFGNGCIRCAGNFLNTDEFIEKSSKLHNNKYTYNRFVFIKSSIKSIITCPIHGDFKQTPNAHLCGHGCAICAGKFLNTEEFIIKANKVHNNKYNYKKFIFTTALTKGIITCQKHGDFEQVASYHLSGNGCQRCKSSVGEKKIAEIISYLGYIELSQFKLPNCKDINPLPFDFAILDNNTVIGLIEYQGIQHYEPTSRGRKLSQEQLTSEFNKTQLHDKIKAEYCSINNIPLLIIPYWDKGKMEELILNFIQENEK